MLQAQVHAGKFGGEQRARQQPRPERAVALKQRHTTPLAPKPQQSRGAGQPERHLKNRRHFCQCGLGQRLLKAPQQAAAQQQADGQAVKVAFPRHYRGCSA